jgi:uncharacterized coiled-coil protein SlyX
VGEGAALPQDVEVLREMIAERDTEIAQLREYIRLLKSQRFGASSERTRCGDVSNPPHIDLTEITLSDATQNAA